MSLNQDIDAVIKGLKALMVHDVIFGEHLVEIDKIVLHLARVENGKRETRLGLLTLLFLSADEVFYTQNMAIE